MVKSSRIRIEAEDDASEVFDQVADKALERMKDVGEAGKFAIQLSERFDELTTAMHGNTSVAREVGEAAKAAGSGLGALGIAAAETVIKFEKLLSIGRQITGNEKLLALLRGIGALGTGTVAAVGAIATIGAGAAYVGAKVSEQDSRNEEARNRTADPLTLSKHYQEFYLQAAQDLGRERAAELAKQAGQFTGIAGLQGSREIFYESVRKAREEKQAADAAAELRRQAAEAGSTKGMEIFGRFDIDLQRQQRLAELDTRGRAELEMRTRIASATQADPSIQLSQQMIDSLIKRAGDWAVQQEKTAKEVADQKDRELQLAIQASERYQELASGGEALRRRFMSDDARRKEEEAELFKMAMQGAIDNWTYQAGLVDIAAHYRKNDPTPVKRDNAQFPFGGVTYESRLVTRGPGPETSQLDLLRKLLTELKAGNHQQRLQAKRLEDLMRNGLPVGRQRL